MKVLNKTAARLATLVTCSLLALVVQAAEIPARGPIPFDAYDRDSNGSISEAEFSAVRAERMAAKTAAGMPMRGAASQPSFSVFDADGDGQLSPEELAAGQQKTRLISPDEFSVHQMQHRQQRKQQ
ncbi:EF-hand domain-containing protein [Thiolapillus sp.]